MKKRVGFFSGVALAVVLISGAGLPAHAAVSRGSEKTVKYFPGEAVVREITWRKDRRIIRRKIYHKNGRLRLDIRYDDGRLMTRKEYYPSGRRKAVWTAATRETRRYSPEGVLKKQVSIERRSRGRVAVKPGIFKHTTGQ